MNTLSTTNSKIIIFVPYLTYLIDYLGFYLPKLNLQNLLAIISITSVMSFLVSYFNLYANFIHAGVHISFLEVLSNISSSAVIFGTILPSIASIMIIILIFYANYANAELYKLNKTKSFNNFFYYFYFPLAFIGLILPVSTFVTYLFNLPLTNSFYIFIITILLIVSFINFSGIKIEKINKSGTLIYIIFSFLFFPFYFFQYLF